jgi:3-dehydroquinate dehydratase I
VPLAGKICVSIAATGDVSLLKEQADRAFSFGADFAEIRFDFVSPNRMQAAIDTVRGIRSKTVFTLRSKDQGGKFAGSEQERIEWLKKLAEQKPMLLDVELDTIKENDELADFLEKTPILVSWHDFQQTPPSDELADILSEMRIYSNYVKVVTTAKSVEDSLRLLELYESTTGLHPVIFAMGDAGIVSRILCTIVGNAPFTYTSLEKAVAPGQLTVKQMRKLYDRIASGT